MLMDLSLIKFVIFKAIIFMLSLVDCLVLRVI